MDRGCTAPVKGHASPKARAQCPVHGTATGRESAAVSAAPTLPRATAPSVATIDGFTIVRGEDGRYVVVAPNGETSGGWTEKRARSDANNVWASRITTAIDTGLIEPGPSVESPEPDPLTAKIVSDLPAFLAFEWQKWVGDQAVYTGDSTEVDVHAILLAADPDDLRRFFEASDEYERQDWLYELGVASGEIDHEGPYYVNMALIEDSIKEARDAHFKRLGVDERNTAAIEYLQPHGWWTLRPGDKEVEVARTLHANP